MDSVLIAVMGATGSGKSTFVNLVSGSHLPVSEGLRSCTQEVQTSVPFDLDGYRVTLIDTPGFDDTLKTDTEILKVIASFLADSYRANQKLHGVVFMHRISDPRLSGISRRNFSMFRSLCGDSTLGNVLIVTNMWSQVDAGVGAAREHELATDDALFKPVLDKGAKMVRHTDTRVSAQTIVRTLLKNRPLALRVQQEIVDEKKDVERTAASQELKTKEMQEAARRHEEEVRKKKEAAEAALREQEAKRARELEAERQRKAAEEARARAERERLQREQSAARKREEERQRQVKLELERAAAQRREEEARLHQLRAKQQQEEREAAEARARHAREMERLREEDSDSDDCVIF